MVLRRKVNLFILGWPRWPPPLSSLFINKLCLEATKDVLILLGWMAEFKKEQINVLGDNHRHTNMGLGEWGLEGGGGVASAGVSKSQG